MTVTLAKAQRGAVEPAALKIAYPMYWLTMLPSCLLLFIVRLVSPPMACSLLVWLSLILSDGRLLLCEPMNPFLRRPTFSNFTPSIVTSAFTYSYGPSIGFTFRLSCSAETKLRD